MNPKVIQGGKFSDHRGTISYVNDFSFKNIERFYIISNSDENPIRAWQGHKLDAKNFYCVEGSFKIHFVKIDNWENPSKDLNIETIIVNASESKILYTSRLCQCNRIIGKRFKVTIIFYFAIVGC